MRTGAWDPGVNGGTHHAHGGGGRTGRTSDPVFGPIFVFFGILSAGGVAPQAIAGASAAVSVAQY